MRPYALAFVLLAAALPAQNQGIHLTNGVDGSVDYAFYPAMLPPTGLTVEAWLTYDDSTIATGTYRWPTVARLNPAPGQEDWFLRVSASNNATRQMQWSVRDTSNTNTSVYYSFAPGEFAQWTHIACTYDGANSYLYKNGQVIATQVLPGREVFGQNGNLRIGNGDPSAPGYEAWNGNIAEFRIWPFARTQAEILATMNQELSSMPGGVMTFNLDGQYIESSRAQIGTQTGTVSFVPGPPLTALSPIAANVGQSTTTCTRTIDTHLGSLPRLGNAAFAVWCTKAPLPAASPFGLLVAAYGVAPGTQPPMFGVNLAFDLSRVATEVLLLPPSSGLGNTSFGLPIPNLQALSGVTLVMQFGFSHAACGPQGFTASNGLQFTVQ
jgi:hypothetical protein